MGDRIHEVRKTGNLYFLANGFIGALNRLADSIGKGLAAVALALSTPKDNSADVKEIVDKLRAMREDLAKSIEKGD